ncbi:unnamed protein product [Rotaria sordida]|uniref:Uncharacterized protein n=1 Tax=Rotaria sordida TaxID=392033 RepID=A0A814XT96_9BILA|nr:unnamed protein product [Rotaria sordida]
MVLFPRTGLGRFLLLVIIISTISYLVLNLVSFGGNSWITYTDVPIRFGLWRVCDMSTPGYCNQWFDDIYTSNVTSSTFPGGKPGFIRSSQALEIISLIFYIFAAFLIILGIINLDGLPFEIMFLAAAVLLFICIIFLSATLGVMSVQGRNNHPLAFLDWAWWNGLVGLIMTIVTFVALIGLIIDMRLSPRNNETKKMKKLSKKKKTFYGPSASPTSITAMSPPIFPPPYYSPPQIPPNVSSSQPINYPYNQGHNYQYSNDYFNLPGNNFNNSFGNNQMQYGGQYPSGEYNYNQNPSPLLSSLVLDYALRAADAQFQSDALQSYYFNTYL